MTARVDNSVSPEWAVEASGLVKRLGATLALSDVDLRVRQGSVHGLLGPNGAGKTTLLRLLFGLLRPDAGELRLFGRTRREAGHRLLDGVAGFVETPRFYPYLTGYRCLEMLADYDASGTSSAADAVGLALDAVGLAGRAHEKTSRYSLGMRQRLGIAAALLRSPRLLVLDEPANGLDPAGARDMRALIRRLADDGLTVLMSSHVMSDVEALCDEVTILSAGAVAASGNVEELRRRAPSPEYHVSTSDDRRAVLAARAGVRVLPHPAGGLAVTAQVEALDRYVIELGCAGIAVRALRLETTPLEALFFGLTDSSTPEPSESSTPEAGATGSARAGSIIGPRVADSTEVVR